MTDSLLAPDSFRGGPLEDASNFIDKFEAFCTSKTLEEGRQVNTLPLLLRDNATTWYSTLTDSDKKTYAALKKAFLNRYGLENNRTWGHVAELFTRHQKPGEQLLDYITFMRRKGNLLKLPHEQITQAIFNGLDPAIRLFILQQDPKDLDALEKTAQLIHNSGPSATTETMMSALADIQRQLATLKVDVTDVKEAQIKPVMAVSTPAPRNPRPWQNRAPRWNPQPNYHPQAPRQQYQPPPMCGNCGKYHLRGAHCPAKFLNCLNCSRQGHIAAICRQAHKMAQ